MKKFYILFLLIFLSAFTVWGSDSSVIKAGYGNELGGIGFGAEYKSDSFAGGIGIGVFPGKEEDNREAQLGGSIFAKLYSNTEDFEGFWGELGFGLLGTYQEFDLFGSYDTGTLPIWGPFLMVGYTFNFSDIYLEIGGGFGTAMILGGDSSLELGDLPSETKNFPTIQLALGLALETY
jgi:hypothetical protein